MNHKTKFFALVGLLIATTCSATQGQTHEHSSRKNTTAPEISTIERGKELLSHYWSRLLFVLFEKGRDRARELEVRTIKPAETLKNDKDPRSPIPSRKNSTNISR